MRIVLLTGPGGDAQGWGDLKVTRIRAPSAASPSAIRPASPTSPTKQEFYASPRCAGDFDIVWSALYHITPNEAFIGRNGEGGMWVADVLDEQGIPYIGSNSRTMKDMIDKFQTHEIAGRGRAWPCPSHHPRSAAGDDAVGRHATPPSSSPSASPARSASPTTASSTTRRS
ncbi:MAG: hypothetical protein M0C28_06425 [Candidatus Moduliflexus flocculans]|nr:hypothetical protein [Candidatus Moduliflexus flocculans]